MKQIMRIFFMVVILIALGSLGYIHFKKNQPLKFRQVNVVSGSSISVSRASSSKLDPNTTAASTPPVSSGVGSSAVSSNLQSNVNVSDPSLQNNSLVKSVNTGVSP